jgi:hypothetical protein
MEFQPSHGIPHFGERLRERMGFRPAQLSLTQSPRMREAYNAQDHPPLEPIWSDETVNVTMPVGCMAERLNAKQRKLPCHSQAQNRRLRRREGLR